MTAVEGNANLSGMARSVNLNTGVTGADAITVNFFMRMKQDVADKNGNKVDVIGGKVLTFGIPKLNPSKLDARAYLESLQKVRDADLNNRHYIDVKMQFYNGKDSTFVFDVTDQARRLFRGGVITVELDMDKVPVPNRSGGSGFDAVWRTTKRKNGYSTCNQQKILYIINNTNYFNFLIYEQIFYRSRFGTGSRQLLKRRFLGRNSGK